MAQSRTISKQNSGFKFKWWMAVLAIGLVVATGVLIRLLSQAGTAAQYNKNRAYVLYSDNQYLGIVKLKQYDYSKIFDPASSAYVEEQWINLGKYPQAAGTYKANTVPRWVKSDTLTNNGLNNPITANTVCATLQKVITLNGKKSLTNITAIPPLAKGDNLDLAPSTNCDSPAQG